MKLSTVNVIESHVDVITKLTAFKDDELGNKEANKLFVALAVKKGMIIQTKEFHLDMGHFGLHCDDIYLVHSTVDP